MTRTQKKGGGGGGERIPRGGGGVLRVIVTTKPQKKASWRQQVWWFEMSRNRGQSEHKQLDCSISVHGSNKIIIYSLFYREYIVCNNYVTAWFCVLLKCIFIDRCLYECIVCLFVYLLVIILIFYL